MKAVVLDGDPQLTQLPDPELSDDQVRVRVQLSPITGLDLDIITRRVPFRGVPGTYFTGVVEEGRGRAARALVGRRVVGRGSYGCGDCDACRAGAEFRCLDRIRVGQPGGPGTHAEKIVLPTRAVLPVPSTIDEETAAILPMLAVMYAGISRVDLPVWTNILVVGDGGTGLLAALAFSSAGYTVTVRGKHGSRFDLLRQHSIHFNLVTDEAEVGGRRPGRFGPALGSYPFVVEATGQPAGWEAAVELVSLGGTIFMLSSCNDGVPRALHRVQEKNVGVLGLREGPIEATLSILAGGLFRPTGVITRIYPFEKALDAYRRSQGPNEWLTLLRMSD